jgi:hypothetical protein
MSYIILRGRWCDIIVLNIHAPTEDKTDNVKGSFDDELERVFDKIPKYYSKILLRYFSAKASREEFFKPKIRNDSLHDISPDEGVRVVNFSSSKNLFVKSKVFPHGNIHKNSTTLPNSKIHH